jgi:hypothetical protein
VRPGWLDRTTDGEDTLILEQGDTVEAGVSRQQVAQVLVRSVLTNAAVGKTFELFAGPGPATEDPQTTWATTRIGSSTFW